MPDLAGTESAPVGCGASDGGRTDHAECMRRIAYAMHEMCQPLMALQCRLEIGRMIGTAAGYEESVRDSLAECDRLLASVNVLREEVRLGLDR